jgi:DNA-binding transcriptional MerR regulator
LRVFQYALAYAHTTKVIEAERITLTMPEARVIYWETSRKTPDRVTLRIIFPDTTEHCYEIPTLKLLEQSIATMEQRRLVLLAPFYLLKYRKAVRKGRMSVEERRELAGELKELMGNLEGLVDRAQEEGIISRDDGAALFEHLVQMYTELYKTYPEFKEAAMHLEERVKTQWQHYLHQGKVEERNRLLTLLEQGYTLNQIKSLLAQESGQEPSGEATDLS